MAKMEAQLMREMRSIRYEVKRISFIVESRLVGFENPTADDINVIREFERKKKEGKLKLIPISKFA